MGEAGCCTLEICVDRRDEKMICKSNNCNVPKKTPPAEPKPTPKIEVKTTPQADPQTTSEKTPEATPESGGLGAGYVFLILLLVVVVLLGGGYLVYKKFI